jgi:hypothetical protein
MAESNAVVAQVAQIEVPVASTTPTVGGQATSAPAGEAPPLSAPTVDPPLAVGPGPVVILAAPEPIPPARLAGPSLYPGPVAQHDLEQSAQRTKVVIHKSRSIVSRSTFLRAELSSSATASNETSSRSSQSLPIFDRSRSAFASAVGPVAASS